MAKVFYVSPGRSYTVTAAEGTTITYPGITKPAATVGASGSVTFNCTGTEITVSDDSAQIAQNFNNAGAAVAGAGEGSGGASLEGVALLEGGNNFQGNQTISGDVTINGALTVSGDVTAEGSYNGAEVIETSDTTITPESGKYYKYTGTEDTITVSAPVWNGYAIISYLETAEPVDLQGVTWSPAKPSMTGAGPFVYTLVCADSGSILASAMNYSAATAEAIEQVMPIHFSSYTAPATSNGANDIVIGNSAAATYQWTNPGCTVIGNSAKSDGQSSTVIGRGATAYNYSTAIGDSASAVTSNAIAIGCQASASKNQSISIGATLMQSVGGTWYQPGTHATKIHSIALGSSAFAHGDTAITIGATFVEAIDDVSYIREAKTEGTGSITIGAGANTLNTVTTDAEGTETTVESSNSVTIGCKASNKGADSIVIGAQAIGGTRGLVVIGTKATAGEYSLSIGNGARASNEGNVAIGHNSNAYAQSSLLGVSTRGAHSSCALGYAATASNYAIALGHSSKALVNSIALGSIAKANATNTIAIGRLATVSDVGAVVFRSTAEDGTYTQLYFSGANTPLANTYEDGEAMMGYVVRDSAGNIMTDEEGNAMVGTQKLSVLFPNNRGENVFTPATTGLDDEGYTPKPMFHPSDLDLPIEEPTEHEPEEYQPLPVYPIVEPEIPSEPSEEP